MTSPTSRVLAAFALALAALTGCSAATPDAGPPADSTPGSPVVAFYGDSYTRGTGATDPSRRWSTLVCEKRGWAEVNPSVDGLGFVNNRELLDGDLVENIVAEQPDIVIVTMGLNDNFSMPGRASAIEEAITGDLEAFADELPDARIIVVEPFWYTDERPRSVDTIIGWVRGSAAAIDAEYISGASRWLEGHPEWMAADGIHPNNDGYAEIASRMDTALTDLGL
jgi:lysophospholipase L1-like esterase